MAGDLGRSVGAQLVTDRVSDLPILADHQARVPLCPEDITHPQLAIAYGGFLVALAEGSSDTIKTAYDTLATTADELVAAHGTLDLGSGSGGQDKFLMQEARLDMLERGFKGTEL